MSDPIAPDDRDGVVPPSDMVIPGPRDLRAWRQLSGLTQQEVARRADVSISTVRNVEKGRRDTRREVLVALTTVYADEFRERDDSD